jgi:hypothetical protein
VLQDRPKKKPGLPAVEYDRSKYMDVSEAGKLYLGLNRDTSHKAALRGDFPYIMIGRKRLVEIDVIMAMPNAEIRENSARVQAKRLGLRIYRDVRGCKYGHEDVFRRTDNGSCIECLATAAVRRAARAKPSATMASNAGLNVGDHTPETGHRNVNCER